MPVTTQPQVAIPPGVLCKQGVRGSSPLSSTRQNDPGPASGMAIDHQG